MDSYNQAARIDSRLIPTPADAVRQYEAAGGHLTHFGGFGTDPVANNPELTAQREAEFHRRYPSFDPLFHTLVNGDNTVFCTTVHLMIHIT